MAPSPYLNDPKVYIDTDTFIDLVSERTRCLICCEPLNGKVANREHVLPKWILRKYDLYDKEITLPHDYKARQYGGHTMPCCKDCNSLLGKKLEQPVRQLTQGGYAKLQRLLDEEGTAEMAARLPGVSVCTPTIRIVPWRDPLPHVHAGVRPFPRLEGDGA